MRRLVLIGLVILAGLGVLAWTLGHGGGGLDAGERGAEEPSSAPQGARSPHLEGRAIAKGEGESTADDPAPVSLPPAAHWEARGRVVVAHSQDRMGVAGVTVRLLLVRGDVKESVGEVVSGENGVFSVLLPRLDELSAAQLASALLRVFADGGVWMQWARGGGSGPDTVRLTNAISRRRIVLTPQVTRERGLRGRVLGPDGDPAVDAPVRIHRIRASGEVVGDGWRHTDPAGEYRLRIGPKTRAVVVHAKQYGVGSSLPLEFDLPADGPLPHRIPDLVLGGDGRVSGRAIFPDGSPAAGVDLYAAVVQYDVPYASQRGAPSAHVQTDADGRFELTGLAEGRVGIQVATPRTHRRRFPFTSVEARTGDLDVLLPIPLPRVLVRVVDENGASMSTARFVARLVGEGLPDWQAEDIPACTGATSIWARPGDKVAVSVLARGLRPAEATVHVAPGAWTTYLDVILRPWVPSRYGSLRLEVSHEDGRAVEPMRLQLSTLATDQALDGFFGNAWEPGGSLPRLPPGRWRLTVRPGGRGRPPWAVQCHEIEVRPGEETVLRTTLGEAGVLLLRTARTGRTAEAPPVYVELTPDGHPGQPLSERLGDEGDGVWPVAAGAWIVGVQARGVTPVTKRVLVDSGKLVEVEVRLGPE